MAGKTMTAAEGHEGWYTMHLTLDNSTDYNLTKTSHTEKVCRTLKIQQCRQ